MEKKKLFVTLLGAGVVMATPWTSFAQENQAAAQPAADQQQAPAQAEQQPAPAQTVTDGGVEAVNAAQEGGQAEPEENKEAESVLRSIMEKKGWEDGWDPKKKRFIAVGTATFKSAEPAKQKNLQEVRRFAVREAELIAKSKIITFMRQEADAETQITTPGTDLNRKMNAEVENLMDDIARQREVLADLLEKKNKAKADELRGTTIGDRLNDLMAAAIKKLDKEYDANARDKAAAAKYKAAVEKFTAEKNHYNELIKKAKSLRGSVVETHKSTFKSMAAMPLFGATVLLQTESWAKDGTYQVSVMMVWSNVLERAARAIVTGEKFKAKPSPKGKKVQEWLREQDLACMIGPRQYIDKDGNRWFLGIAAERASRKLHPRVRHMNEQTARMWANQEAIFCVMADVKTQESAAEMMQLRESGKTADGEQDLSETTAKTMARNLGQKTKMTIRGGQVLYSKTVKHPISGEDIYVVVYGYNPLSIGPALAGWTQNYATKVQFERHQTVERGRQAAANAAVQAAKNRPEDFQKGYNQQSKAIKKELQRRQAKKGGVRMINKGESNAPARQAKSTSGTFGGDTNVDDDF